MPMRQRRSGASRVISVPANSTRPASGTTVPHAMPNNVVLPAPFGPMMPSASPSASTRSIACATITAPNRLEIFSKARMEAMRTLLSGRVAPAQAGPRFQRPPCKAPWRPACAVTTARIRPPSRQQLQLAAHRNFRRGLVGGDDQVELVGLALPLPRDERRLGDVLHRLAGPLHRADHRFVIGRHDGIEDRLRLQRLRTLEQVDGDLEQRVLDDNWLRPTPAGGGDIDSGVLGRVLDGSG